MAGTAADTISSWPEGLFTQEDPIGIAGGLNLYGYANGDPINFSDPFGLCVPWCAALAGVNPAVLVGGGLLWAGAMVLSDPSTRDVLAQGLGGIISGLGNLFAEDATQSDPEGAKSADEYDKHIGKLGEAQDQVRGLQEQLANAKGPRAQRPIREAIERLQKEIKGHLKEVRQKWPEGRPEGQ